MAALLVCPDADAASPDGLSFGIGDVGSFLSSPTTAATDAEGMARRTLATARIRPSQYYPVGSLSQLFNHGGVLGGFAAGFLGTGLLGVLFGRGLFGGLGSVASYLGLLLQAALWLMLARLIWTRWRAGNASDAAALSPRQLADPYLRSRGDLHAGFDHAADSDAIDANTKAATGGAPTTDRSGERS